MSGIVDRAASRKSSGKLLDLLLRPSIFLAVFFVSVLSAHLNHYLLHPPFAEQAAIAEHLLHGDGFASPFDPRHGAPPSSWTPPLYPWVIAAACRIFGDGSHAAITFLMLLNSACYGAIAAALYELGRETISKSVGIVAAVLIAIHPIFLNFSSDFWDSFVALAIFGWILVGVAKCRKTARPLLFLAMLGSAMGLLTLTNASYACAYPLLVLAALRGRTLPLKCRATAIAILSFALVLSPWTIRNAVVFHRLQYVRGGASFEMWMGNQPISKGAMEPAILSVHPKRNPAERNLLLAKGEPAYFDWCRTRLQNEIRSDPGPFLGRTFHRVCYLFLSDPTEAPSRYFFLRDIHWHGYIIDRLLMNAALATLGLAGAWATMRMKFRAGWILAAGLLAELPFSLASVGDRYVLPLRTTLIFFTALTLCTFASAAITRLADRPKTGASVN